MYTCLEWDSRVLQMPVARIESAILNHKQLCAVLDDLAKKACHLVYWASDSKDEGSQLAAQACRGILADKKITLLMEPINPVVSLPAGVIECRHTVLNAELLSLAYAIGGESRFFLDANFSRNAYQQVYQEWLKNSLNRTVAQQMFVAIRKNKIVGMVTLRTKNGVGEIALIAVLPECRGQGIAHQLLDAACYYFSAQGVEKIQVVTQLSNHQACRLYEKYGFHVSQLEHFYHFWLK